MSWTSTRTTNWIAVVSLLAGCSGPPTAPEPRGAPAEPATVDRPGSLGGTLPTSIPPDMRAWFAARGVQLPAMPPPAAKVASSERLLGDGTGNGTVGWWDLWHLWNHLAEGYEGFTLDLDALDINRSGAPDWIDLGLLGDYLYGSGANPHGIGQPIASETVTASLSPHSDAVSFDSDGEDWKRFTVQVTGGVPVVVTVNGLTADTVSLEISKARSRPTRSFCPAERNDDVTVEDGDVVWIAGCSEGNSSIFIQAQDGTVLWSDVSVPVRRAYTADTSFDIELVFAADFLPAHRDIVRAAADQWEQVITADRPDMIVSFDSDWGDSWADWRQRHPWMPERLVLDNESVDDLRIYVGYLADSETFSGRAGPFWMLWDADAGGIRPAFGVASFHREHGTEARTALHEIGHVLGLGTLWTNQHLLAGVGVAGDAENRHFTGALALAAWRIAGGDRWRGPAVPVEADDNHWKRAAFGDELMTPTWRRGAARPLSEVTIQALADMGYTVDVSQADPYTVPATGKLVAMGTVGVCGVGL